eukprot:CAMPEP_0176152756 /NCGR_PEP_ID=MMETSP0120_2-20121206/78023_1 /TAXON_ID=160619 /ORGANISM="Kryptoperidinium foliaceum, Strain CCMP 1326" /LENGTH=563 /DNA_ID=CAMNT_0017489779 /DNA_START=45 /DNA_END=1731 /DNA_ORIENTATION=-
MAAADAAVAGAASGGRGLADVRLDDPELRQQALRLVFKESNPLFGSYPQEVLDTRPCRRWVRTAAAWLSTSPWRHAPKEKGNSRPPMKWRMQASSGLGGEPKLAGMALHSHLLATAGDAGFLGGRYKPRPRIVGKGPFGHRRRVFAKLPPEVIEEFARRDRRLARLGYPTGVIMEYDDSADDPMDKKADAINLDSDDDDEAKTLISSLASRAPAPAAAAAAVEPPSLAPSPRLAHTGATPARLAPAEASATGVALAVAEVLTAGAASPAEAAVEASEVAAQAVVSADAAQVSACAAPPASAAEEAIATETATTPAELTSAPADVAVALTTPGAAIGSATREIAPVPTDTAPHPLPTAPALTAEAAVAEAGGGAAAEEQKAAAVGFEPGLAEAADKTTVAETSAAEEEAAAAGALEAAQENAAAAGASVAAEKAGAAGGVAAAEENTAAVGAAAPVEEKAMAAPDGAVASWSEVSEAAVVDAAAGEEAEDHIEVARGVVSVGRWLDDHAGVEEGQRDQLGGGRHLRGCPHGRARGTPAARQGGRRLHRSRRHEGAVSRGRAASV